MCLLPMDVRPVQSKHRVRLESPGEDPLMKLKTSTRQENKLQTHEDMLCFMNMALVAQCADAVTPDEAREKNRKVRKEKSRKATKLLRERIRGSALFKKYRDVERRNKAKQQAAGPGIAGIGVPVGKLNKAPAAKLAFGDFGGGFTGGGGGFTGGGGGIAVRSASGAGCFVLKGFGTSQVLV